MIRRSAVSRVVAEGSAIASDSGFALGASQYDAVVLLSFGGPEGPEDVVPFLKKVTSGRGVPDERLYEVAEHYNHFSGISPINDCNRQLRGALEKELFSRGIRIPVLWANRNWQPQLEEVLREAYDRGFRAFLTLFTSAYSCYSSCRQYREDIAHAVERAGLSGRIIVDKLRQFFDHPGFVLPFIEGIQDCLEQVKERGFKVSRTAILFSTHSIPELDAAFSGPEDAHFGKYGAYVSQHKAVVEVIMSRLRVTDPDLQNYQLVYQSRSGDPSTPWLEPDINDAIRALRGCEAVLIVPLGFISDHMEVLWDLDNESMQTARECGLFAIRTPTPGTHPLYISGMVDLIVERLEGVPRSARPAMTDLGPWFDVCQPGCCKNSRSEFKPAYGGVAP
ncbi:ferrochelatase [Tropheryma whipplei]|uniref:ferrochelatase n=1 Tax=Tropheryma whipplei TaxID=2039 RepID=UPI0004B6A65D|nr:ferrochelatase [Tropheryma whipplei]